MNMSKILKRNPFIVAEVGSNFKTLEDCKNSIVMARNCGADAVKFQVYNHEALYGVKGEAMQGELPIEWLPILKEKADACGIEFMCSAFSPELLEIVDPFVNIHKLASSEMCHLRMLGKLKVMGKPTFVSMGAHTLSDIRSVLDVLDDLPVVLMYCVAAYPARIIDLREISFLENHFKIDVGYSDHSTDVLEIPNSAVEAGAQVIEKHVNFANVTSPDSPHSLSTEEFKLMVDRCRGVVGLGSGGPTREEKGMILRHKRRIIATKDILKGETLVEGVNYGIFRSLKDDTKACHPFMVNKIQGKTAIVDIPQGDGIWIEDLI
jgi:N-acetylneuraminate synthase